MKKLWLTFSVLSLIGCTNLTPPQTIVKPEPVIVKEREPAPATTIGRYYIQMSTLNARDVFLVDTSTGKTWQREGPNGLWHMMKREK